MSAPYSKSLKTRIPLFERLLIESQSNCNRSCWFCPRTYDRSGKYLDPAGTPVINQMPTEKVLDLWSKLRQWDSQGRWDFTTILNRCSTSETSSSPKRPRNE